MTTERAINIAVGCIMVSYLPNDQKTEIIKILRDLEENAQKGEETESCLSPRTGEGVEVMREIIFRGKRVDNGGWVHGCYAEFVNYLDGNTKPGIQITRQVPSTTDRMIPAFETELIEVIPETVGQFTGLRDKNGIEIYKGDICDTHTRFGKGIVEWERGMFKINGLSLCTFAGKLEVIGNIHDNPELLEVPHA